jgi:hypothetical protein
MNVGDLVVFLDTKYARKNGVVGARAIISSVAPDDSFIVDLEGSTTQEGSTSHMYPYDDEIRLVPALELLAEQAE